MKTGKRAQFVQILETIDGSARLASFHFWRVSMVLLPLAFSVGCSVLGLSNSDPEDTTTTNVAPAQESEVSLLSAFYGLDDGLPPLARFLVCGGLPGSDGMPVVFSQEIDLETMQAGDFRVVLGDDREGEIVCVTPAPANDTGELRTILMVGEFGSAADPPLRVEITGNLLSMDHRFNFRGDQVDVTRLEDGPSLVLAESVPVEEWGLDQSATRFPFGGGSGCPASTRQVVRVVWNGGVTKPGGDEIDDVERSAYRVLVEDEAGEAREVSPFAIGDLGDGDNNHELCLDTEDPALRVAFPGGLVTDPREDLNLETAVTVTR
ncbi:MAG: hypothetical protein CL917_14910 [Deltaproteobacteria bacterium]|nr:hypothetical protein [Deltaproteobacteria bacterium]